MSMSDEPRYEPIDDAPPPDPDEVRPAAANPAPKPPIRSVLGGRPPTAAPLLTTPVSAPAVASVPAPVPRRYRLSAALPAVLIDRIKTVRAEAKLPGDVDTILFSVTFNATDQAALDQALAAFNGARLPFTLKLAQVQASVQDRQGYRAAWELADPGALTALRADVLTALKIKNTDSAAPFEPLIRVADGVPAKLYPALIAAMQRTFTESSAALERITLEPIDTPAPPTP